MDVTTPVLDARDLFRFFHAGNDETLALRGVSLSVSAGELVAVTGSSGSGKSTLLACLAGLDNPDGGMVRTHGEPLSRRPETEGAAVRARSVGMLFQSNNLFGHLTAKQLMDRLTAKPDAALVSAETARDFQLALGDTLHLRLQDGRTKQFTGVFEPPPPTLAIPWPTSVSSLPQPSPPPSSPPAVPPPPPANWPSNCSGTCELCKKTGSWPSAGSYFLPGGITSTHGTSRSFSWPMVSSGGGAGGHLRFRCVAPRSSRQCRCSVAASHHADRAFGQGAYVKCAGVVGHGADVESPRTSRSRCPWCRPGNDA